MANAHSLKVLWLSSSPSLFSSSYNISGYFGGGWISSLQKEIQKDTQINLALAFPQEQDSRKVIHDDCVYYLLKREKKKGFRKLAYYYGGYKKEKRIDLLQEIRWVLDDFQPDIIQLFGIESELACVLGETNIPVIVHLQGLLGPCDNAFFPCGFGKYSFLWPPSIREWVFRNGVVFAKNHIRERAKLEKRLFKRANYLLGRTEWDRQVASLLAPQALYFHVDEILRDVFYQNAGRWSQPTKAFTIVSTISNTVYKGLDVILKTAHLLKSKTQIEFEWRVIGVADDSEIVGFFEHETSIKAVNVGVSYQGVMDAEQLCKELLNAHVYVHPSYIDNSPNSLCEAQMLGVPVAATNVGGISSLVRHKETGVLVPANAPYELAYWLKELENNKELLESLSINGSRVATKRHNKDAIHQALCDTYMAIITKNEIS